MQKSLREQPLLAVIPSVSAVRKDNQILLDNKAVSGLGLYSQYWPGSVRCIFREGSSESILFGSWYDNGSLPFDIAVIPNAASVPDTLLKDAAVVLGSGDNHLDLPLAAQCRSLKIPLLFVIEYTLETRFKIIGLSDDAPIKKLKSLVWTVKSELERRRAFVQANALQANGTPAADAYKRINSHVLIYFDTRLSKTQAATDSELAAKAQRLMSGAPLRLAFTGRLEKMKGADDLIRVANALHSAGKNFQLDIFGTGGLESEMETAVASTAGLRNKVHIHAAVDFDKVLVPLMRSDVDIFVCCHRQADPSCTYLETLGCGVPIIGYKNGAWQGLLNLADVGWKTRMGAFNEIATTIERADENRSVIVAKMKTARNFGMAHSAEAEFKKRVDHLVAWLR